MSLRYVPGASTTRGKPVRISRRFSTFVVPHLPGPLSSPRWSFFPRFRYRCNYRHRQRPCEPHYAPKILRGNVWRTGGRGLCGTSVITLRSKGQLFTEPDFLIPQPLVKFPTKENHRTSRILPSLSPLPSRPIPLFLQNLRASPGVFPECVGWLTG